MNKSLFIVPHTKEKNKGVQEFWPEAALDKTEAHSIQEGHYMGDSLIKFIYDEQ